MGEVVSILQPARWISEWEALGGFCTAGEGPFGLNGECAPGLLAMVLPGMTEKNPQRITALRGALAEPTFRMAVARCLLAHKRTV